MKNTEDLATLGSQIDIRGTHLFMRSFGSNENPVLLVVHGGPGGNHEKLLPLKGLSAFFKIVFYDQRGTGKSERIPDANPESASSFYSLDENIEDIEAIRVWLGEEKMTVLGHSWGGALATFYAAKYPSRVEKLIVYSGGPEDRELATTKERRHAAMRSQSENELLKSKIELLEKGVREEKSQSELDNIFSETIGIVYPSLYFKTPLRISTPTNCGFWSNFGAGAYIDSFDRNEFSGKLKKIESHTLLIWGRHEPSPQERLLFLLDHIPNAQFVTFEQSGHNAMEEEPNLFFRVLEAFLNGQTLPTKTYKTRAEVSDRQKP